MKKLIKASASRKPIKASQISEYNTEHYFQGLYYTATNAGYDMDVTEDFDIILTANKDKKFMPEITIKKREEDAVYYYDAEIKFPELRQVDMEYYDDIDYYIKKWQAVGEIATEIAQTSFQIGVNDVE